MNFLCNINQYFADLFSKNTSGAASERVNADEAAPPPLYSVAVGKENISGEA